MIAIAPTPPVTSSTDVAARIYIQALCSGTKPTERPATFGRWDACIKSLEKAFKISNGSGQAVANMLENLVKSKRYPGLADLVTDHPDDEDEDDTPMIPELPEWARTPKGPGQGQYTWSSASPGLEAYVDYSEQISPEGFKESHPNCFLSLLSAIAARRVCIPFKKPDYTPLMILMCSEPSIYKKSTTAGVVEDMLKQLDLDFLVAEGSSTTPQSLVYDMVGQIPKDYSGLDRPQQEFIDKTLAFSGQRWQYNDEFGQSMKNIANPNSVMSEYRPLLLEIDSCKDRYTKNTVSRGKERINKPYLSLLGAMTPANIRSLGAKGAEFWQDGFWSRFIFVTAPRLKKNEDPPDEAFGLGQVSAPRQLLKKLDDWHKSLGLPTATVDSEIKDDKETGHYTVTRTELPEQVVKFGKGVYEAWRKYRSGLKRIFARWNLTDLNASYDRLATRAIRVAALIASLENKGVIELKHWYLAQEFAERWRVSLHELYHQVHQGRDEKSKEANAEDRIIEVVRRLSEKGKPPTIKEIKDYCKNIDRATIDLKCKKLVQLGDLEAISTTRTTRYKYIGEDDE